MRYISIQAIGTGQYPPTRNHRNRKWQSAPKNGQPSSLNINDFLACVDQHFTSTPERAEVAILVTVPDADKSAFLANWNGQGARVGIGIDAEDDPQIVIQALSSHAGRFSYGNGVSVGCDPDLYFWMSEAKALQMRDAGQTLRLVYPRTLAGADAIRDYLDLHVDSAIVDLASVTVVRDLLNEPRFATLYEAARISRPQNVILTENCRERAGS